MKKEKELILELCKYNQTNKDKLEVLLKSDIDFPYVLGQLLFNRVGGVAYHTLKKFNLLGLLNREIRNTLQTIYLANTEKTISFKVIIDSLNTDFESLKIPYAFLKGSLLCFLYPLGCRTSNDIDVLINAEDIDVVSEMLVSKGYEQGYLKNGVFTKASRNEIITSRMMRGETVPFIKRVDFPGMEYAEIDINISLDYKNDEKSLVDKILGNCCTYSYGINSVRALDKYDFIIQLCSHLYKEATVYPWVKMGRDLSLYKFLDIYMLVFELSEEDCVFLYSRICDLCLFNECYYSLVYINALFAILNDSLYFTMLELSLNADGYVMSKVISPENGKIYIYNEHNLVNRLFDFNRKNKLEERNNAKVEND